MKIFPLLVLVLLVSNLLSGQNEAQYFPDGSRIPPWFFDTKKVKLEDLGKQYPITDFGVKNDSTLVQTWMIQRAIDVASEKGGGVIVIPKGVYLTGALFFKPNTHLHLEDGAKLKGSDNISDYPKMASRMEGQNLDYYPALINVYNVQGFTLSGNGTIDGNGLNFWKAFWQRREENPDCTNLEVARPRLLFFWNCWNVQVQDVRLHNAGFWTSHYYKCRQVKILDLHIYSPREPVKAPSTDAIDIDACSMVLIKGCYMSVNDDAIALKGGKGPFADKDPLNGKNSQILIEGCEFGFCHAALTCGSESIHNKNILMRNCVVKDALRLLWLKMRPDTPQKYEFISLENIAGQAHSLLYIKPWTQFFDLKGREDIPLSYSENITLKNIDFECDVFFDVAITEHDKLSNFTFKNMIIKTDEGTVDEDLVEGLVMEDVLIEKK